MPACDDVFQVAVRGGKDPHVDLDRIVRADAGDLAVLQHPQELDLRGQRHVAHLVEEERAAVGVFELAHAVRRGVGEGPFDVAEQLALQNVLAQGGTVQGHEGLVLPRAVLVDGLGDELLAGAGLALDEQRGVGGGDAFQPLDDVAHLAAVADHAFEAEFLVQPPVQFQVGPPQPRTVDGPLRGRAKLVNVQRLGQVVEGPFLHGLDGRRDRTEAGQQDDLGIGLGTLGPFEDLQAVDVVHLQIGENGVEFPLFDEPGAFAAGSGHAAAEPGPIEAFGHGFGVGLVVVDDQHFGRRTCGRRGRIGRGARRCRTHDNDLGWITLMMLAIITFSLFVGGLAWVALPR